MWLGWSLAFLSVFPANDPSPATDQAAQPVVIDQEIPSDAWACSSCLAERRPFESDHAFDGFVGPVSNPVFSKDPRNLTEVRLLFLQNWIPSGHAVFPNGNYQVYAAQARVALTDRLTLIADKDGYGVINPENGDQQDGWLNIAAGLKYLLIRDVENQFLLSLGAQYELQSGEAQVFQSQGSGQLAAFATAGKEFWGNAHFVGTIGHSFPMDRVYNTGFLYTDLHLDYGLWNWFYPLVELNWFHYTSGGNWGIPHAVGEGDGHINFGTSGMNGDNLVTIAIGAKAKLNRHVDLGIAWETPISNREDLIADRITSELILRY